RSSVLAPDSVALPFHRGARGFWLHGSRGVSHGSHHANAWAAWARIRTDAFWLRLCGTRNPGHKDDGATARSPVDHARRSTDDLLGSPARLHSGDCGAVPT